MTVTRFRRYQDVAAVEHDEAGKPVEGGQILPATVTDPRMLSVLARFADRNEWYFLLDSCGRAWRESGRWRLVPVCRCELPVLGEPVTDPNDPTAREFCSDECRDSAAEASYEQRYQPGVAT